MRRAPKPSFSTSVPSTAPKITLVSLTALTGPSGRLAAATRKAKKPSYRHRTGEKSDRTMAAHVDHEVGAPHDNAVAEHAEPGDDLQAGLETQHGPGGAHAQTGEEAVGRNGDAGRQCEPYGRTAGAGAERQGHDAERDHRDGCDLARAQGLADREESRDRGEHRRQATRQRIDDAHVADAIGADQERVVGEHHDGGDGEPFPALRRGPVDERQALRGPASCRSCGSPPW